MPTTDENRREVERVLAETERRNNPSDAVSTALVAKSEIIAMILSRAVRAVDKVHGDGSLPILPVLALRSETDGGKYQTISRGDGVRGRAFRLLLNPDTPTPEFTALHEIGHFLDEQGWDLEYPSSADETTPAFTKWQVAVFRSTAFQELIKMQDTGEGFVHYSDGNGAWIPLTEGALLRVAYLLSMDEIWARCYAQYIAVKSGDQLLISQLDHHTRVPSGGFYFWEQWEEDDFAGIMTAIDDIIIERRWSL